MKPILNKCDRCVHKVFFSTNQCIHRQGRHTMRDLFKPCMYFKCQWCNQNRCRCNTPKL